MKLFRNIICLLALTVFSVFLFTGLSFADAEKLAATLLSSATWSGTFTQNSDGGDIIFDNSVGKVRQDADTKELDIVGGSAAAAANGAYIQLGGLSGSIAGDLRLNSSNASGSNVIVDVKGSSGTLQLKTGDTTRFTINQFGQLVGDGSNGGDIIISRTSKGLAFPVNATISAAGSSKTDCTALSKVINRVTVVGAGQGVCLYSPDTTGDFEFVQNLGANNLKLYPPAGHAINGGTTDAPVTLTTANLQIATCLYLGSSAWACGTQNASS